ncbi:MAG: class II glutamine amidotransferase [Deltaproteobacteria bacterium]|nr:class II glutamine amidotransferase [Deltaproteobacteria bacterium]
MDFCFALLTTDARLLQPALEPYRSVLHLEDGAPHGWGLGYFQAGEALLRKHPQPSSSPLDWVDAVDGLRAQILLGQRRARPTGRHVSENTQPYRYRRWMFVHSGAIEGFEAVRGEVLPSIPDFIRRNIRGTTDSEHLFHLFLAFLNDAGALDNPRVKSTDAASALSSTLAFFDKLTGAPSEHCCIATNGHILLATHRGMPMQVTRSNCQTVITRSADNKPVSHPHLRAVLLTGGSAIQQTGWESIAEGVVISVDSELNISYSDSDDRPAG